MIFVLTMQILVIWRYAYFTTWSNPLIMIFETSSSLVVPTCLGFEIENMGYKCVVLCQISRKCVVSNHLFCLKIHFSEEKYSCRNYCIFVDNDFTQWC